MALDVGSISASVTLDTKGWSSAVSSLQSDVKKMTGSLQSVDSSVSSLGSKLGGTLSSALKGFGVALSAVAIKEFVSDIVSAGLASERLSIGMASALGSVDKASGAYRFLIETTDRLGVSFTSAASAYQKLAAASAGTAMEGVKTEKVFTAISTAAAALKLSADDTSGALYAISQMISKGTVQAEELRGQLGERLPGAFNLAAEAMGVTTAELGKMLEKGEVVATDFLPRFAAALQNKYAKAALDAADSTQSAVNRMTNSWEQFKRSFGEVVLPAVAAAANAINRIMQSINPTTLEGKIGSVQSRIEKLRAQTAQPFYFAADKEELAQAEKELADLTAQSVKYKESVATLTDEPLKKIETAHKRTTAEINKQKTALNSLRENLLELRAPDGLERELAKISNEYEKMKGAIGGSTPELEEWYKLSKQAAIENNEEKIANSIKSLNDSLSVVRVPEGLERDLEKINIEYEKTKAAIGGSTSALDEWRRSAAQAAVEKNEVKIADSINELSAELAKFAPSSKIAELDAWYASEISNAEQAGKATTQYKEQLQELYDIKMKTLSAMAGLDSWYATEIRNAEEAGVATDEYRKRLQELYDLKAKTISSDTDAKTAKNLIDAQKQAAAEIESIWDGMWDDVRRTTASTIVDIIDNGLTSFESFGDALSNMFKRIFADIAASWITSGIKDILGGSSGGGESMIGSLLGGIGSMLGGSGGATTIMGNGGVIDEPVVGIGTATGKKYILGEDGPEAVIPLDGGSTAATGTGSGTGTESGVRTASDAIQQNAAQPVIVNISAVDAPSLMELMRKNPYAVIGPIMSALKQGDRGLIRQMQTSMGGM